MSELGLDLDALERRTRAATSVLGGEIAVRVEWLNQLIAAARELERIHGAFQFCAFSREAAHRWDEVDTAEDLIRLATELGWDPKGTK